MKSEIRNPKLEGSPNCEIRKDTGVPVLKIRPSIFEFLSDFGLRVSDLRREDD